MDSTLVGTPDPEPRPTHGGYPPLVSRDRERAWARAWRDVQELIVAVESGRTEAVWK